MTVPALDDVIRSPERLAAFRRVRESAVDTAEAIGRLAPLAARLLRAPMAVVTLADDERQWVQGAFGVPEPWASTPELPLDWGFCVEGLTGRGARMVSDLGDDPDLAGDPAIHQLGAVSAAWAPLLDDEGLAVGVLTVIDTAPRHWDDVDRELLTFLAGSVMREMQLRARLTENLRLIELTRDAAEREALRARQLRELAETTVVLASTLALDDRLRIAVEKSRDLIGANFAAVWKRAEGSRDDVRIRFALSDAEGLEEWRGSRAGLPGRGAVRRRPRDKSGQADERRAARGPSRPARTPGRGPVAPATAGAAGRAHRGQ